MKPGLPAALAALLLPLCCAFAVQAAEYGHYEPKRLLTVTDTPSGKKHGFDGAYLDRILNDLSAHARNYPPQFDSAQDKQRATQDVKAISGMLDILINVPSPHPELLVRAGLINSIGYNLDIPGSGEKASAIFQRLLAAHPAEPRGYHLYGTFLAGAGKPREAQPQLEKALALGVTDAAYALGMVHLALGDKERALASLEDYKRRKPDDRNIDRLLEALRSGKVEIRQRQPAQ